MKDVIIIGAGAAGLTAATYSLRYGLDTLVIESMAPGGQLMYIDKIENYPSLSPTSGFALADMLQKQAESFGAEIIYDLVTSIEKEEDHFSVLCSSKSYKAKAVIIATGATHKKLSVEGEDKYEGHGVSYCATCDGPFFKGKDVCVVGGGDSALTEALYLSKIANSVKLIHRRDTFRAQEILVNRVKEDKNISLLLNRNIKKIVGADGKVNSVILDDDSTIQTDGIFIFAGIKANSEPFKALLECDEQGFIITDDKLNTSIKGIFAAGDVRNTYLRQVVTATSDGALASFMAEKYISRT